MAPVSPDATGDGNDLAIRAALSVSVIDLERLFLVSYRAERCLRTFILA